MAKPVAYNWKTKSGKPKLNDASLCRVRGFVAGDVLRLEPVPESLPPHLLAFYAVHPERSYSYVLLTAVGEESVLVRPATGRRCGEKRWARQLLQQHRDQG